MTGPGLYTNDIFRLADGLIDAGWLPGLADKRYVLLLIGDPGERFDVHRQQVNAVLRKSYRVWLVKGRARYLLGESSALPAEPVLGMGPPFW